jgi:hypothetical protein
MRVEIKKDIHKNVQTFWMLSLGYVCDAYVYGILKKFHYVIRPYSLWILVLWGCGYMGSQIFRFEFSGYQFCVESDYTEMRTYIFKTFIIKTFHCSFGFLIFIILQFWSSILKFDRFCPPIIMFNYKLMM